VADVIGDWKKTPGTVGIRIILTKEANRSSDDPGLDSHGAWRIAGKRYAFMTAAERLRVVNLAVAGLKVR
jgi:hypothetical protein